VGIEPTLGSLINKTVAEVNLSLGQPTNIPSAWDSSCPSCLENIYQTEMGRFTIIFVNNKSYWIIINGIDDIPLDKETLTNIGLPVSNPSGGFEGFMHWDSIGNLRHIAFVSANNEGIIDDISVLGIPAPSVSGRRACRGVR
jgi:hypothetical protein